MLDSRITRTKIKSPFIIYADFEDILVLEDNGKQNPEESYMSIYQKHVAWSYDYKLVSADDKFRKSCKSYLGDDMFTNLLIVWSKKANILRILWKIHFNSIQDVV